MAFSTQAINNLIVFHKPWFSGTPQNAKKSSAVLSFSGVPVVAEVVVINGITYEFVAAAEDVTGTNIAIVLGATLTADNALTVLETAINANDIDVTAVKNTTTDTLTVTTKTVGTENNLIEVSTDATNATWGVDVTTLSGGQYATPCNASSAIIVASGTVYISDHPVTKYTENGWYSSAQTLL